MEPRVEERDGYWVLKEKYRGGINPQEKVKLEKEPMKLFMEGGVEQLSRTPLEDIEGSKITRDDVDVRLKWLGLFHRRKHHCELVYLINLILPCINSIIVVFIFRCLVSLPSVSPNY